jgi:hypothetical protein
MRDKSIRTYKIDDLTAVKLNDSPGKFSDIKTGMLVVDFVERDGSTLDGISVQPDDTATPSAKKKSKKST